MLLSWIADVHLLEFVRCLERRVGDLHEVLVADLAEPARLVVAQHFGRLGSLKENHESRVVDRTLDTLTLRYFPHSFSTFFSILFTSGSKNAACPLGVPMA